MTRINPEIQAIIDRAFEGKAATQEECVKMLKLDPHSPEACALRGANALRSVACTPYLVSRCASSA